MPEYSREQLWKIYELLPEDLKSTIFAGETAEDIATASEIAGVQGGKISEIARYTGRVLMGLLPPEEFQEALEKKVKIEKSAAKKVAHQIQRLVFNPVKESLAMLYEEEKPEVPGAKPEPVEEAKAKPKKEDVYREPIE